MNQHSTVPEYTVVEQEEMLGTEKVHNSLDRDFEQVVVEVQQLLVHSIKVLNSQDAITVRLQVLLQSLQEQE